MARPLIDTDELAAILGAPDLRVVDASWRLDGGTPHAAHETARIPGAVLFDIDAVSDRSDPLPHMLPSPADFAEAAGALGIGEADHIVVYDEAGVFSAARVWWTFRVMGADRVRVLDGGLPRWRREGRPLETGPPAPPRPARFNPRFRPDMVADRQAVRAALSGGNARVIDARPAARFRGEADEPRRGLRRGHMPGAASLPFTQLLTPEGALRPPHEIEAAFREAGLAPEQRAVTTCGSGVTAAVLGLALATLGRDSAVYDGSWAEWGADADAPVATGL